MTKKTKNRLKEKVKNVIVRVKAIKTGLVSKKS